MKVRSLAAGLLILGLALLLGLAPPRPAAAADESLKVDRLVFPVTLSDGQTYSMVGYLYYHGSFHERTLQVLVSEATYNHRYWDLPTIDGHAYSYADYMAEQHYAVLALDTLGSGESSKPDGDFLTLDETASGLHQVLARLHTASNPTGYAFPQIALVGDSMGGVIAVYEQGTYHDANALVTTALSHVPHPLGFDISFINLLEQWPYFTFPLDIRDALFYNPGDADPAVINYDNANLADTFSRGQLNTVLPALDDNSLTHVDQVTGPVLVQLGENDPLFPSSLAPGEAAFWTHASSVTVQSLPQVGHSFNTHLDNATGWAQLNTWLQATLAH
ncbi:MAG TPA: alpha/beta hydrolase [Chloroflexia bacterium]|nr:alpha/beta hydrolase [Chloroflexia bacterium]